MKRPRKTALLGALLCSGALALAVAPTTGCGEPEECTDLVVAYIVAIETECDVPSRCSEQADPDAPPPRLRYSQARHQTLVELLDRGCDPPDLGEMPFFCSNAVPACPSGYTCGDASFSSNVCLRRQQ